MKQSKNENAIKKHLTKIYYNVCYCNVCILPRLVVVINKKGIRSDEEFSDECNSSTNGL